MSILPKPLTKCHVTLASNLGNLYSLPNSVLNFRERYQIWGKLDKEQKSYKQKTNWGVENTPSPVLTDLTDLDNTVKFTMLVDARQGCN